jgi:(p)ppGpp synthase/HD superfamily hydrolase
MNQWNAPDLTHPEVQKAYFFAMGAHAAIGQKRKYADPLTGIFADYIVHPVECVGILQTLPSESNITVEQIQAMLLHDVVEDTRYFVDAHGHRVSDPGKHLKSGNKIILVEGVTIALIERVFGPVTARITSGLTDVSMPWDGNRETRKALDLAHTSEQESDVKTDKLADLLSNAPSIIEHDPGFARKWMSEKAKLLPVLVGGDPILHLAATNLLNDYLNRQHNYGHGEVRNPTR